MLGDEKHKLAVAFDPFFLPKAGDNTYGKDNFWSEEADELKRDLKHHL